jgi:hypothetical protein
LAGERLPASFEKFRDGEESRAKTSKDRSFPEACRSESVRSSDIRAPLRMPSLHVYAADRAAAFDGELQTIIAFQR